MTLALLVSFALFLLSPSPSPSPSLSLALPTKRHHACHVSRRNDLREAARCNALLHSVARTRLKILGRNFARLRQQAIRRRAVDVHRLHLKDFNFEKKVRSVREGLSEGSSKGPR